MQIVNKKLSKGYVLREKIASISASKKSFQTKRRGKFEALLTWLDSQPFVHQI